MKFAIKLVPAMTALGLLVTLTLPMLGFAEEAKKDEAPSQAASAPRFFSSYEKLLEATKGTLPLLERGEYVGQSLLPFGSRNRAIQEAKENALKSNFSVFVLVHDREEKATTGIATGIYHVIKLRPITLLPQTPENLLSILDRPWVIPDQLKDFYGKLLSQPESAFLLAKEREWIKADSTYAGPLPIHFAVRAVIALEGKAAVGDLKKWARYHSSERVRSAAYKGLLDFGENEFVEEAIKSESDRGLKNSVEDSLRKSRL